MHTREITHEGVTMELHYEWDNTGEYHETPDIEYLRLYFVYVGDYDIIELLSESVKERITEKLYNELEN